jgi:hypothetical protein
LQHSPGDRVKVIFQGPGRTTELDDTVKQAADLLGRQFNRDIEIRFNSDARSGGAWLKNSLPGFSGNCQVGLGAGITPKGHTSSFPEGFIYVSTYVSQSALKDKSLATWEGGREPYSYKVYQSLEGALDWLIEHVDTGKILD